MECARCGSTDRSLDASFHCSTCYAESVARVSGLERRIAELEVALERAEAAAAEADRKLRAEEFPLADKWNRAFVNMRGWMLALRSGALYSNDFIKTARVLTARALAGEECGVHNDTDLASAIESCRRYAESFNRVAELEAERLAKHRAVIAGVAALVRLSGPDGLHEKWGELVEREDVVDIAMRIKEAVAKGGK
jgi:hypothetical protein